MNISNLKVARAPARPSPHPPELHADQFPDQPVRSASGPPATVANVRYMLDATGIRARYNVIKKRLELVVPWAKGTPENADAIPSYAAVAQQHLDHARTYQRSFETTEMYIRRHILPRWGKMRLTEIRQPEIARWLVEKADEGLAPATVEKIRVIMGRSFELAKRWGIPGSDSNPVRGIPRKPISNARERFLNAAEAKRLMDAVQASRNTQLPHIVSLLLLTGARVSELLHAEWRHVDLERRAWLIPTSKTGKPRHVPLSQAAIDVLRSVPRFNGCPYVLPNPDTLKPFVSIKHAWQKARDDAYLPGLRIHDLRHSAASFMINAGVDLFAVGRVLGHADHKSTMRYSHLANDTLLAAVEAGAKRMNTAST